MTDPVGRVRGRYAVKPGGKPTAPSVTIVLGAVINKPGLVWAAAGESALFAIHHQDEWMALDAERAYDRIRKHHRGIWDDKANRGSAVHALALGWTQGQVVDCPPDCGPYLDALERFYDDWQPEWVECERTVVYDDPTASYGGTFDAVADLGDGHRWLLDIKTGAAIYPEVALQLAAYRYAKHIAVYSPLGALESLEPMVEVERCGVIHLREDGTYSLVPVRAEYEEFDLFLYARHLYEFCAAKPEKYLGKALTAPRLEAIA